MDARQNEPLRWRRAVLGGRWCLGIPRVLRTVLVVTIASTFMYVWIIHSHLWPRMELERGLPDTNDSSSKDRAPHKAPARPAMAQQARNKTASVSSRHTVGTSRDGVRRSTTECSLTSYRSDDQGRHVVNVPEANRLVQRFQLDWNLRLPGDQRTPWKLANRWVSPTHVYPEHSPEMGAVLKAMSTAKIEKITIPEVGGVTFKLFLTLAGGQFVLFKPQWYERTWVTEKDGCHVLDNLYGDVVAFHLSRILGFRKTPIAVGRTLDLHKEIIPVASPELLHKINVTGCTARTAQSLPWNVHDGFLKRLCSWNGHVRGAMILWLPKHVTFREIHHPWGGICTAAANHKYKYFKPGINSTEDICREAKAYQPFRHKPGLFLDLVDASILQYLVRNIDRRLYVGTGTYADFMPVIDNGRREDVLTRTWGFADNRSIMTAMLGLTPDQLQAVRNCFGYPDTKFEQLLAPLSDCCRLRESTYRRLQKFQNGTLSYVLDVLTERDPVYPLLSTAQNTAMDRRLHVVLDHIQRCICKHGRHNVLLP